MVLVRIRESRPTSSLAVIRDARPVREAIVLACGPEVRDLQANQLVIVNVLAATAVDGCLLVPAHTILGTL